MKTSIFSWVRDARFEAKRSGRLLAITGSIAAGLIGASALLNACAKPPEAGIADPASSDEVNPYQPFHGTEFRGDKNFANLVNKYPKAKNSKTPWAGYWWPYTANGIASAKHGGGSSPAGKYDAARGRTKNAQGWEVKNHGSGVPKVQGWWGHCNGWSAAAALVPEPQKSVTVNGITFDIADIKALVTEAGMETSADFFGERVDFANDYATNKYWDTVPDQYFLVLTNFIGKMDHPVLIDRYTGDQVWNQPLVGYSIEAPKPSDYLGTDPAAPNVHRMKFTSTIWWADDGVDPGSITPKFDFQDQYPFMSRTLTGELWLDAPPVFDASGKLVSSGDVIVTRQGDTFIGGTWKGGEYMSDGWPDYMWVPFSFMKPTDYANPEIEYEWIRDHILSGGVDDPTVSPRPPETAPSTHPTPTDTPTNRPTTTPTVTPTFTPTPTHTIVPGPTPTSTGTPRPRPTTET